MPIHRGLMAALQKRYGEKKGESVYYAMERKQNGHIENADALTTILDEGKEPTRAPIQVFASSYWEQWLAKQKSQSENLSPENDLLLMYLLNMGNRPDLGAGLKDSGAVITVADGAVGVSSASGSGAATTVSNLGEIVHQKQRRL